MPSDRRLLFQIPVFMKTWGWTFVQMTCGLDLMCWLPKNRGFLPPKMDGENNGSKPYEQMDDLGGFPIIFGNTHT